MSRVFKNISHQKIVSKMIIDIVLNFRNTAFYSYRNTLEFLYIVNDFQYSFATKLGDIFPFFQ